jgi:hypothetical protein
MGSMQDRIMEAAVRMDGPFTTADMTMAIYGDTRCGHMTHVRKRLHSLVGWGDLERVGRRKVNGTLMMVWRVV